MPVRPKEELEGWLVMPKSDGNGREIISVHSEKRAIILRRSIGNETERHTVDASNKGSPEGWIREARTVWIDLETKGAEFQSKQRGYPK